MSIGNQKFGIPRKYQYQIGIWYSCPKFLGIFLVFYRYLEYDLYKIWLNIGIFSEEYKSVWYLVSVKAISLVLVWFRFVIFLKMTSLVWNMDSMEPASGNKSNTAYGDVQKLRINFSNNINMFSSTAYECQDAMSQNLSIWVGNDTQCKIIFHSHF